MLLEKHMNFKYYFIKLNLTIYVKNKKINYEQYFEILMQIKNKYNKLIQLTYVTEH